jgi:hypothetical protein
VLPEEIVDFNGVRGVISQKTKLSLIHIGYEEKRNCSEFAGFAWLNIGDQWRALVNSVMNLREVLEWLHNW